LSPQVGFTRLAAVWICRTRASPSSDAIHVFAAKKGVDARDKRGHDGEWIAGSRPALTKGALNARNHLLRLPFSRQEDFTMNKEQIREHMEVLGSDGKHIGTVDHVEGEAQIKLAKKDVSAGGKHHLIPLDWVDHVDNSVHLKKTSQEAIVGWRTAS